MPSTAPPLFNGHPFVVTWNIPDLVCKRHNISLDTSPFHGVSNPAKVPDQFLILFYTNRLGLYPYVDLDSRRQFYGGIPQRGNLEASLEKARADILHYIPSESSSGLAIIDWEDWRPLWERNWGSKRIYRTLSVSYARHRNPSLPMGLVVSLAKRRFQSAAKRYMLKTLTLGTELRSNYLWGFYLFPNCYNYGWEQPGYTGHCSEEVQRQNEKLLWLWEASTALFPSIYLPALLGDHRSAALMVRNRVQEAMRVAALPNQSHTAPVYVYSRPVFIDQNKRLLSQGDLVSTIGESAAVGASGAIFWGATADYDDKASCEAFSYHLDSIINPYIINVTTAAKLCSNFLCQGKGRCVRKNYNMDHYLHLSAGSFSIQRGPAGRYEVLGMPSLTDLQMFTRAFTCQCYASLKCEPETILVSEGKYPPSPSLQSPNTTPLSVNETEDRVRLKRGGAVTHSVEHWRGGTLAYSEERSFSLWSAGEVEHWFSQRSAGEVGLWLSLWTTGGAERWISVSAKNWKEKIWDLICPPHSFALNRNEEQNLQKKKEKCEGETWEEEGYGEVNCRKDESQKSTGYVEVKTTWLFKLKTLGLQGGTRSYVWGRGFAFSSVE
ncbi:hyaluronidase PH-20-like [Salminus brasiliensis]|uniref:hyaluronidase PH-20-like n=1 Tax=Salminus brasiliensis TaxID=930266 RepID=UPI003B838336